MVDQSFHQEDSAFEYSLRPTYLKQYIGQTTIKSNLEVFIQAAKLREEPLDHVLLFGPLVLVRQHYQILLQMRWKLILELYLVLLSSDLEI